MRVAAIQFENQPDPDANLATILRLVYDAAASGADLVVLPEFSNHLSWYDDAEHAWAVAVQPGDSFWTSMAQAARRHKIYLVVNVSLQRQAPDITVTSLLFSPAGECIAEADKQTLMGHENRFFTRAQHTSDVIPVQIEDGFARLALFPCRDGVTFETARGLGLRGAQIFCDSLNSFALDEASLHVPARAPENKVFLVAANKVGPLIPREQLSAVSAATAIPEQFLMGAGESQIVAPDGRVLAKAPRAGEAVIWADINPRLANDKQRPDGSSLYGMRRPELYRALTQNTCQLPTTNADKINVALLRVPARGRAAIHQMVQLILQLPAATDVAVLPELFWRDDQDFSALAEEQLLQALQVRNDQLHLVFSRLEQGQHLGLVLNQQGRQLSQGQLHAVERLPAVGLVDELRVVDLPFGRIAVLVGDDSAVPEVVKLLALKGIHLLCLPWRGQEPWEASLGLASRAAENRICIAAASATDAPCNGLLADLELEFTLMQPWQRRRFDGYINAPLISPQTDGITWGQLTLVAAANKVMSENTDLLAHRPWHLCADLIAQSHHAEMVGKP